MQMYVGDKKLDHKAWRGDCVRRERSTKMKLIKKKDILKYRIDSADSEHGPMSVSN